jgi:predicted RNA-binding Zn-ribbon protein involved in translation (DUF1610 family)
MTQAKYVCISNNEHITQSEKFVLAIECPVCGGFMECDNLEEFD